jgi:hypothetical protein
VQDVVLLLQKGLDGSAGGFLPFKKTAVELGGFLLHLLQYGHAFSGNPQGICQKIL